jgi:hypothetical protein
VDDRNALLPGQIHDHFIEHHRNHTAMNDVFKALVVLGKNDLGGQAARLGPVKLKTQAKGVLLAADIAHMVIL